MPILSTYRLAVNLIRVAALSPLLCFPSSTFAKQQTFPRFELEAVISHLDHPWALEAIGDAEFLVTTKPGQLLLIQQDQVQTWIKGVPEVLNQGQGGLMDIELHPDYKTNGWIYLSYAYAENGHNATRILRAHIHNNELVDQQIIFTASPLKDTYVHYGARMVFLPDNSLIISVGDGFDYREDAQRLDSQLGKLIRIKDDGSLPDNNPRFEEPEANPFIWSYGHRNPQGLYYDKQRKILFEHEHGPAGGDEINLIQPGKNYGWPVITKGKDYSGAMISPYQTYPGMEQPFIDWTPSIAPSSMLVYRGEMFKEINGDLLVTTLKTRELRWLKMQGNKVVQQKSLLRYLNERLRDIKIDAQGAIYILTDGEQAKLLKVTRRKTAKDTETTGQPAAKDAEKSPSALNSA
ncbi:PQQ-dependent sugar dehydrogenase [Neptunicella sp. SCSIO 80796]|uniref:PQQ-dependent sugar dehydrogenase n=1 Tax=Neptunicella plasticusilytica TaxID=3117012 RepID=UPI003A4D888B